MTRKHETRDLRGIFEGTGFDEDEQMVISGWTYTEPTQAFTAKRDKLLGQMQSLGLLRTPAQHAEDVKRFRQEVPQTMTTETTLARRATEIRKASHYRLTEQEAQAEAYREYREAPGLFDGPIAPANEPTKAAEQTPQQKALKAEMTAVTRELDAAVDEALKVTGRIGTPVNRAITEAEVLQANPDLYKRWKAAHNRSLGRQE